MFRAKPWIKALKQLALLSGCPKNELALFDSQATELRLPAGTVLLQEGSFGRQWFVVANGVVAREDQSGSSTLLEPGASVGEVGLLDRTPETATITAVTDVSVYVMHEGEFRGFVDGAPTVGHRLGSIAAGRRTRRDPVSNVRERTPVALATSA